MHTVSSAPAAGAAPRVVIGFTGKAGSGKSTAAAHMIEAHGFTRVRFAGPLKAMVAALGLDEREIEGDLKEKPSAKLTPAAIEALCNRAGAAFLAIGVDLAAYAPLDPIDALCGRPAAMVALSFRQVLREVAERARLAVPWYKRIFGIKTAGATPRLLMQMIGTEWGRDKIGGDLWIDLWRRSVDRLPACAPVVVDDCRFPNEAGAISDAGGALVRIMRPGAGTAAAGHSSEHYDLPACSVIENDGEIEIFRARLDAEWRALSWALARIHDRRSSKDGRCGLCCPPR